MRALLPKEALCLLLAGMFLIALLPCAALAGEDDTHIVILATSDLHGNVFSFSYEDNVETTNNGMARRMLQSMGTGRYQHFL